MEHLAIMDKTTINKIINGTKTIESRFSKNKITPYKKIKIGDIVYLKESGKDILANFKVSNVLFFENLNLTKLNKIKNKYNKFINAPADYWDYKKDSKYGTLMYISNPKSIKPIKVHKRGRQAFITVNKIEEDLPLIDNKISKNDCDCNNNLHLFYNSNKRDYKGNLLCSNCGKNIVNWNFLKTLPTDYDLVFKELKKAKWNYDWFQNRIDNVALKQINNKNIKDKINERLINSILKYKEKTDGKQTPYYGNIIYYAQHATATCCRDCLAKWYGISKEVTLTDKQLEYFTSLIYHYIDYRKKHFKQKK